jgi:hypothetical protein
MPVQRRLGFGCTSVSRRFHSPSVPFPFSAHHDMLVVNSFSGEEPVRAIRPMTPTGSGTFCFGWTNFEDQ